MGIQQTKMRLWLVIGLLAILGLASGCGAKGPLSLPEPDQQQN